MAREVVELLDQVAQIWRDLHVVLSGQEQSVLQEPDRRCRLMKNQRTGLEPAIQARIEGVVAPEGKERTGSPPWPPGAPAPSSERGGVGQEASTPPVGRRLRASPRARSAGRPAPSGSSDSRPPRSARGSRLQDASPTTDCRCALGTEPSLSACSRCHESRRGRCEAEGSREGPNSREAHSSGRGATPKHTPAPARRRQHCRRRSSSKPGPRRRVGLRRRRGRDRRQDSARAS